MPKPGVSASYLQTAGVELFAVAIGGYSLTQLSAIVSQPEVSHVYALASYTQLSSLATTVNIQLNAGKLTPIVGIVPVL